MRSKRTPLILSILAVVLIVGGTIYMSVPKRTDEEINLAMHQYVTQREMREMGLQQQYVTHLSRKYGHSLKYEILGLWPNSSGSGYRLVAYLREEGTPETHQFEVIKTINGIQDSVVGLYMREELEEWIAEEAGAFFDNMKAFAYIGVLPNEFNRDSSVRDLSGHNTRRIYCIIFVSPQFESKDEFYKAAESFFEIWEMEKLNIDIEFIYVKQEAFDKVNRANHIDARSNLVHYHSDYSENLIAIADRVFWSNHEERVDNDE